MSSSPPTARQVHATTEAARTERTHSETSNPSAPAGTSHLFGARGPIDSTSVPTTPHTVDSKLDDLGAGSYAPDLPSDTPVPSDFVKPNEWRTPPQQAPTGAIPSEYQILKSNDVLFASGKLQTLKHARQ